MIVAIDGPAGAGKSSVAKEVAARLGFRYLDTGAMYRAVTHAALARGINPADADAIAEMMRTIALDLDEGRILVGGRDVSSAIRSEQVTQNVSAVAAHPLVRAALVPLQREAASGIDTIVEGRDIGTVVFPDADLKVFLTATTDERARRRARQLEAALDGVELGRIARDLERRDRADATRSASPFAEPADARVLDTTNMTFEEVVQAIVHLVRGER